MRNQDQFPRTPGIINKMNCCFAKKKYNFPKADYKHNNVCMNSVEIDWRLGLVVLFMEKNIYFS